MQQSFRKPLQQKKCTVSDVNILVNKSLMSINLLISTTKINTTRLTLYLKEAKCTVKDAYIIVNKCFSGYKSS